MRKLLVIISVLVGLTVLAYFVALDRVDYSPFFKSAYYQQTIRRLQNNSDAVSLSRGSVSVGLGRVNITPQPAERAVPMAGYGLRAGEPAEGIHDSLYVKTLAIQVADRKVVVLGADLLIIPPNVAAEVLDRLEKAGRLDRGAAVFLCYPYSFQYGGLVFKLRR